MKNEKAVKVLKGIGAAICVLILVLSVIASFVIDFVQSTVMNKDFYASLCDDQYVSDLKKRIDERLSYKFNERFGKSEPELERILLDCVDEASIKEYSVRYTQELHGVLTQGEQMEVVEFPIEKLSPVKDYLRKLAESQGDELDEEKVKELLEYFADTVTRNINAFSYDAFVELDSYMVSLYEKVFSKGIVKSITACPIAVPLVLVLLSAGGICCLTGGRDVVKKIYNAVCVFWASVTVIFAPMTVFSMQRLPEKLVIGDSAMRNLLIKLLNGLIGGLVTPITIAFAIATVALIVLIVLQMVSYAKSLNNKTEQAEEANKELAEAEETAKLLASGEENKEAEDSAEEAEKEAEDTDKAAEQATEKE